MGMGPVPAIRRVMERTGRKLAEMDLVEINEAFAAQVLACLKRLGWDERDITSTAPASRLGTRSAPRAHAS
jgi:acetyl-CoA C-acetyltransferase